MNKLKRSKLMLALFNFKEIIVFMFREMRAMRKVRKMEKTILKNKKKRENAIKKIHGTVNK